MVSTMTQDNALTEDQIGRLTRPAMPGTTQTILTGFFVDTTAPSGGIKFTSFNAQTCLSCGALVGSTEWYNHGQWHDAIRKTLVMPVESDGVS